MSNKDIQENQKIPEAADISGVEATSNYTYSPDFIIKISWLQKRASILNELQEYNIRKINGSVPSIMIARIQAKNQELFWDIEPAIKRTWKKDDKLDAYLKLKKEVNVLDIKKIITCFRLMNFWLDEIGVTKIDTRVRTDYDSITDELNDENN